MNKTEHVGSFFSVYKCNTFFVSVLNVSGIAISSLPWAQGLLLLMYPGFQHFSIGTADGCLSMSCILLVMFSCITLLVHGSQGFTNFINYFILLLSLETFWLRGAELH
jgi:hypothetical protein